MPRRFHLISLVPLGFALVQVIWAFALLVIVAAAKGGLSQTRAQTHTLDAIGMVPGVLGIVLCIIIMFRSPNTMLDRIVLTVGALACLPLVIAFGKELFTP
jgi:hypothetical protein